VLEESLLFTGFELNLLLMLEGIYSTDTAADNVRYRPRLRGKRLTDDEVRKLLAMANLDDSFMDEFGAELSEGQAQRVALARTLANSPKVT